MGWRCILRGSALLVATACGATSGDGDDGSTTSDLADSSSSSDAPTTMPSTSGDVSSSSSDAPGESSSSADGSTGEPSWCDCADDEICVEAGTDGCFHPHAPSITCVPIPASCDGIEPACETECGWDVCGGPMCRGQGGKVCDTVSEGFVCSRGFTGCNLFDDDCGTGDKCASWDGDQDGAFDTTHCSPVEARPAAIGEPCTSIGSHANGWDDCEAGSMCLSDDLSQTEGICRAACTGNPYDAWCADPEMQCVLEGFWFGWCLPA